MTDLLLDPPDALDITLREHTADDTAYILSTWVRNQLQHSHYHPTWPDATKAVNVRVNALYRRSQILVAASPLDTTMIYGWLAVDKQHPVIHYAYTRAHRRTQGIQSLLLEVAGVTPDWVVSTTCPGRLQAILGHKYTYDPAVGDMLALIQFSV